MSQKHVLTLVLIVSILSLTLNAQEIVTDYDGNEYHTVTIGSQVWLKENLNCVHYSDGTEIPDAVAYSNSEANADVYGRLYTWDAAMRNTNEEGVQGICPDGWHVPSKDEWDEMETYLGGAAVAGGKLKEAGLDHWKFSNVGADNSSGFTALPGGEYDAHDTPYSFRLLRDYAVFWTSTGVSDDKAAEKFLAYNSASSSNYNWYKIMKYSVRAIKDQVTTGLGDTEISFPNTARLLSNMPNPFNPSTTIPFLVDQGSHVRIQVFNISGALISNLFNRDVQPGSHEITWAGTDNSGNTVSSGVYVVVFQTPEHRESMKVTLLR